MPPVKKEAGTGAHSSETPVSRPIRAGRLFHRRFRSLFPPADAIREFVMKPYVITGLAKIVRKVLAAA
ncbi:MAG: hypothetical protein ABSG91_23595 [Syntrophobacteraceae bacterium]